MTRRETPHTPAFDSTLALLRDPYRFLSKTARHYGTDVFETRLLMQPALCLTGPEAAEVFYDTSRFSRAGSMPGAVQKTLLGQGGVQGLDDADHRHRKGMLMSLMTPARVDDLVALTAIEWELAARMWAEREGEVVLYDELHGILTRAVCDWAGVPLPDDEVDQRTRDLMLLFDGAAALGWRHVASRRARVRANAWAADVIRRVRTGELHPRPGTAARVIADHRLLNGEPLPLPNAGVDLLNVLRPTVAIGVFIAQEAHALHHHPACRERIATGDDAYVRHFVQETRRYYPFFPLVAATVREEFAWRGHVFPQGRRVLLDLYGTDHDVRTWDAPEEFRPERFASWDGSAFNFVPQGGGDHTTNHRCAGEWVTIAIMEQAARTLVTAIEYEVPPQDMSIDFGRMPAIPRSGFRMRDVRWVG